MYSWASLLLISVFIGRIVDAQSNSWYILNSGGPTNFTNYTTAAAAAIAQSLPLRARDGAVIFANETVAPISSSLTIIGDTDGLISAFITIETPQSPVFVVSGSGELFVRDLQISFNGTLFNTQGNSLLRLSNVNMWLGTIGVSVQNTPGPGVGMVADHVQCMNLATCFLYLTTNAALNCTDCRFMNARNTAVSVSSSTPSAIAGLNIINSLWINLQFFITIQASPLAVPVQYTLPSNWGYLNNNIIARTFSQTCIQPSPTPVPTPPPVIGGGSGGGGTCPTCEKCVDDTFGGPTIFQIVLLILVGICLIILASVKLSSQRDNRRVFVRIPPAAAAQNEIKRN